MGDSVSDGNYVNGCLSIDKVCKVTEQEVSYLYGKASADSYDKLKEIGDSLVWSSKDTSVATVEGCGYIMP